MGFLFKLVSLSSRYQEKSLNILKRGQIFRFVKARDIKSFSLKFKKKKSSISGAQFVLIGIPTFY